jgi:hypothetical protein
MEGINKIGHFEAVKYMFYCKSYFISPPEKWLGTRDLA